MRPQGTLEFANNEIVKRYGPQETIHEESNDIDNENGVSFDYDLLNVSDDDDSDDDQDDTNGKVLGGSHESNSPSNSKEGFSILNEDGERIDLSGIPKR